MISLSLIVLTRNEETIVAKNLEKINKYLKDLRNLDSYEILVCDKSEDSTPAIVKSIALKEKIITYHDVQKKGIGAAMKKGIDNASYEFVFIYPIDMAWKIDIIEKSVRELIEGSDIVYGSRYAKGSKVARPLKRRIFSMMYRILIKLFFDIQIRDLNGTIALRKSSVDKFRKKLEDDGGFLPTELAIYGRQYNLKIKEIPSDVQDNRNISNQFVFKTSWVLLKSVIRKRIKLLTE